MVKKYALTNPETGETKRVSTLKELRKLRDKFQKLPGSTSGIDKLLQQQYWQQTPSFRRRSRRKAAAASERIANILKERAEALKVQEQTAQVDTGPTFVGARPVTSVTDRVITDTAGQALGIESQTMQQSISFSDARPSVEAAKLVGAIEFAKQPETTRPPGIMGPPEPTTFDRPTAPVPEPSQQETIQVMTRPQTAEEAFVGPRQPVAVFAPFIVKEPVAVPGTVITPTDQFQAALPRRAVDVFQAKLGEGVMFAKTIREKTEEAGIAIEERVRAEDRGFKRTALALGGTATVLGGFAVSAIPEFGGGLALTASKIGTFTTGTLARAPIATLRKADPIKFAKESIIGLGRRIKEEPISAVVGIVGTSFILGKALKPVTSKLPKPKIPTFTKTTITVPVKQTGKFQAFGIRVGAEKATIIKELTSPVKVIRGVKVTKTGFFGLGKAKVVTTKAGFVITPKVTRFIVPVKGKAAIVSKVPTTTLPIGLKPQPISTKVLFDVRAPKGDIIFRVAKPGELTKFVGPRPVTAVSQKLFAQQFAGTKQFSFTTFGKNVGLTSKTTVVGQLATKQQAITIARATPQVTIARVQKFTPAGIGQFKTQVFRTRITEPTLIQIGGKAPVLKPKIFKVAEGSIIARAKVKPPVLTQKTPFFRTETIGRITITQTPTLRFPSKGLFVGKKAQVSIAPGFERLRPKPKTPIVATAPVKPLGTSVSLPSLRTLSTPITSVSLNVGGIVTTAAATTLALGTLGSATQTTQKPVTQLITTPELKTAPTQITSVKVQLLNITQPITSIKLDTKPITTLEPITRTVSITRAIQEPITQTQQDTITQTISTTAQTLATRLNIQAPQLTIKQPITKITPRIGVPIALPSFPGGKLMQPIKKVQGYNVKMIEEGRRVKANLKPLPFKEAERLGRDIADNSLSASYRVVKAKFKAPAARRSRLATGGFIPSDKFRKSKKRPGFFVEKRKFRIDSRGEKEGLTAAKLLKMRRKNQSIF